MVANTLTAIRVEAFKMARSGHFPDVGSIETALEKRGYERVRMAVRDGAIRAHLNRLCRDGATPAPQPRPSLAMLNRPTV